MVTRNSLIFRDVLYAVLIAVILWPGLDSSMSFWAKVLVACCAVAQRVWQHVTYYRVTGKIY